MKKILCLVASMAVSLAFAGTTEEPSLTYDAPFPG